MSGNKRSYRAEWLLGDPLIEERIHSFSKTAITTICQSVSGWLFVVGVFGVSLYVLLNLVAYAYNARLYKNKRHPDSLLADKYFGTSTLE